MRCVRYWIVIRSFSSKDTGRLFNRFEVGRFQAVSDSARSRLDRLEAAETLADLSAIPGNRLEALTGDRKGQYSIRINDQWRICFRWRDGAAEDVEIVDYR